MLRARCSGIVHLKILSLTQISLRAGLHQERFGTSLSFPAGTYEAFSNTSQQEVCKGSSTYHNQRQTPDKPRPDSSQTFSWAEKRMTCSANQW